MGTDFSSFFVTLRGPASQHRLLLGEGDVFDHEAGDAEHDQHDTNDGEGFHALANAMGGTRFLGYSFTSIFSPCSIADRALGELGVPWRC